MSEPEEIEEDFFADLYEADEPQTKPSQSTSQERESSLFVAETSDPVAKSQGDSSATLHEQVQEGHGQDLDLKDISWQDGEGNSKISQTSIEEAERPPLTIKDDGKMFIGGLNWETTDDSLRQYFSKFGEVLDCTVMRDNTTGRSRGFGFLTFKEPKDVNAVMNTDHMLDGKLIDPKRAIPREEQDRTSKIFVGGVSQECTDEDFRIYFEQFGHVIDSTLMMDKDTKRPRGFGFVTFDSEAAVEACLAGDLMILGKPIEVKKAQPRGREEDERFKPARRGPLTDNRYTDPQSNISFPNQAQNGPSNSAMTPQMMAQYWARMQQYFSTMMATSQQPALAAGTAAGLNGSAMQQLQVMQMMQMLQNGSGGTSATLRPSVPLQDNSRNSVATSGMTLNQDQNWDNQTDSNLNFSGSQGRGGSSHRGNRGGGYSRGQQPMPASSAPANAPTGPRNAGFSGGGYRGAGRGHRGGFHPYRR